MVYKYGEVEMREMVKEEFDRIHKMCCDLYPRYASMGKPSLTFFSKTAVAGWAFYNRWAIEINIHLARQNWEMIKDTISHEFAHLVSFIVWGKKGHGPTWKAAHRSLGGNASATYNIQEMGVKIDAKRKTLIHEYRLPSGTVLWINTPTHNKIQGGMVRRCIATQEAVGRSQYTGVSKQK